MTPKASGIRLNARGELGGFCYRSFALQNSASPQAESKETAASVPPKASGIRLNARVELGGLRRSG
jgi:hypothetical protein